MKSYNSIALAQVNPGDLFRLPMGNTWLCIDIQVHEISHIVLSSIHENGKVRIDITYPYYTSAFLVAR